MLNTLTPPPFSSVTIYYNGIQPDDAAAACRSVWVYPQVFAQQRFVSFMYFFQFSHVTRSNYSNLRFELASRTFCYAVK